MLKKISALTLAIIMALTVTACSGSPISESATTPTEQTTTVAVPYETVKTENKTNEQGLADNIDDGTILQTWCWSFNTIKENMKDIAQAGFSAIQTSPINQCKVGENGGMQLQDKDDSTNNGKWYYHYQPTDYVIGNYQLGTEEEFKAMCDEAHKNGVKVIVDAVVNHMSSDRSAISNNVKNMDNPFHSLGDVKDYTDRKEVTQGNLLGLVDLNTQNTDIQSYILNYLKQCVADGADGFRYDGAKHIELDTDDAEYASSYWDVITQNGAKFQYGEILQGGADKLTAYTSKVNVTSSKYGDSILAAVTNGDLSVGSLRDYRVNGVDPSKLVTWVESHDNYCNDGSWASADEATIKLGWAIITARSGGTPLFFSRPNGSSTTDQWGNNEIGAVGSDGFKDKDVAALNAFRTAMIGLKDNILNPMDNSEIMMIEREDKGAVIVSASTQETALTDVETTLSDGTYKDKVTGREFTVADEKLSGRIGAKQIIILYN
ncbi:MAG TPA: alpha-amylase [Clostridiales bacterium]|nr:alpha-amylase [Clostridiales bacterium]